MSDTEAPPPLTTSDVRIPVASITSSALPVIPAPYASDASNDASRVNAPLYVSGAARSPHSILAPDPAPPLFGVSWITIDNPALSAEARGAQSLLAEPLQPSWASQVTIGQFSFTASAAPPAVTW